jgi:hypothetical protein
MADGDRAKLPKWAQQELTRQENVIRYLARSLEEAQEAAGFRADETYWMSPLRPDAVIRFQVQHPHPVRQAAGDTASVDVGVEAGRLTVRTPDGHLAIHPQTANAIAVEVIR